MIPSLRHLLPAILFFPLAAHGTIVTTFSDEDNGSLGGGTGISLREAVKYSAAGANITFSSELSGKTIRLVLGELSIAKSLTIDGSSLAKPVTLSGDKTGDGKALDNTRVILITTGTIILDSLAISGGGGNSGAGIKLSSSVTLTLRDCTLSGNSSSGDGGGIYNLGGNLTLENTVISGNSATLTGGGIYNLSGDIILRGSTLSGNSATLAGGGIYNEHFATTAIQDTTLSGNSAGTFGGGIYNEISALEITNSTVTANSASQGGGIHNLADVPYNFPSPLTLTHTTLTLNFALTRGGGISNLGGVVTLQRTILCGNTAPSFPNITGTFTGSNNLTSGIPLLAPLGDYGGPTHTMPPLPGSPSINASGTTTLTSDQRGLPRVEAPDIGAAEYQGTADLVRFWELDFDGDGSPFGVEQALGTDPLLSDPASSRNLRAPLFRAIGGATLSFGLDAVAASGTRWILKRSPDLRPDSFQEIYRFDGSADTSAPGFGFIRTATGVIVTDENPLPGGAFYRFEAVLEP